MQYINIDVKKVKKSMKIDLKSLIYSKLKQNIILYGDLKFMMTEIINRGGNKLRTYRLFKDNISLEKYLLILNEDVVNTVIVTAGNFEP